MGDARPLPGVPGVALSASERNHGAIQAGGSCAWFPVAARRPRFAQTQIYWPETIGIMEILLSLSITIDEPLELCVSMPINSLP